MLIAQAVVIVYISYLLLKTIATNKTQLFVSRLGLFFKDFQYAKIMIIYNCDRLCFTLAADYTICSIHRLSVWLVNDDAIYHSSLADSSLNTWL